MRSSATRAYTTYQNARNKREIPADAAPLQTDAYQAILNSSLPESEKKPARLAQEILTLLVGGSATTARVMTRMTYHLASEPALLAKLRDELVMVMPDPYVTPPLEQLEKLPYLVGLLVYPLAYPCYHVMRRHIKYPNLFFFHSNLVYLSIKGIFR